MLHVHRAERADRLALALAEILAQAPADPFARDVVAVATRGMERWLAQTMSARLGASPGRRDGVCANVEFPSPGRLIGGALATAGGIDPESDPWLSERTVWPLLHTLEACVDEPWLASLAEHLRSGPGRRFARVRLIAGLFDSYQFRRPEMILAWAAGNGSEHGWQPELWRRLRARIGVPSPAERLADACGRIRAEPGVLDLPERIALFGLTRLAPGYVAALHAIAAARDVHLLLLHPSPALWDRIRLVIEQGGAEAVARGPLTLTDVVTAAGGPPAIARAADPTTRAPVNRLLASWGRESRELQLVLAPFGGRQIHHPLPEPPPPASLLAALQADIRADCRAPGVPLPAAPERRLVLSPDDESIRVHACHGRHRQVEVIREAILHRLAADPTLEPRDVIVMCPDIEAFAPLIQATFGSEPSAGGSAAGPPSELGGPAQIDLRVRLADRSLRQTNPVLGVVAQLLELASSRLTASQVLDLAGIDPVRRRFGLGDEELARIQDWIVDGGIHWGLDGPHRGTYHLGEVQAGTWDAGLRRLLLGVALSESGQRMYGGVLPLDDVEGDGIALAGSLAELIDRLAAVLDSLTGPLTVRGWARALAQAADSMTAVADADAWQRGELSRLLDEVVAEAASSASSTLLALPEARALLRSRLEGRPTRANFRTGHLTICTLHPMRSVPHRVVCLLGLDDGAFPRRAPRDGDNLLLEAPLVGERDPRAEDRQLLLDAVLAAGRHLIVTYTGNDERTNAPQPPAVPVGELLDAIDATAVGPPGAEDRRARAHVLIRHPLQPFDPRNFLPGALAGSGPWSFDTIALEGASALRAPRTPPPPFLLDRLPRPDPAALSLADLVAFVQRPVRAFLRQRLGISIGVWEDELNDSLPVELDALQRWGIGQRLLDGLLAGVDPRACIRAEIARGSLPPGALGEPVLRSIRDQVAPIVRHARAYAGTAPPSSIDTNVDLPGGTRLVGTVSGVRDDVLLAVSYSRLGARHRLAAWVRMLALNAAHPEVAFHAVTIGRPPARTQAEASIAEIRTLGRDPQSRRERALEELARLVELRERGLREPLPLPCQTAAAYAAALRRGEDPAQAAEQEWLSPWSFDREDREPDHMLTFGGQLSLSDLMATAPRADERGPGWPAAEPSRFGALALRLWDPLLAREQVTDR